MPNSYLLMNLLYHISMNISSKLTFLYLARRKRKNGFGPRCAYIT